jgi:hypothetical protein
MRGSIKGNTYIHNGFDLTEDPSDRRADQRNSIEQASLADENIQKHLVDPNELS